MYQAMLTIEEQEAVVRELRGWPWTRDAHGSLWDRGAADSYYHRAPDPHYGGVGGDSGPRVSVWHFGGMAEYMAGYNHNEQLGFKKDWQ